MRHVLIFLLLCSVAFAQTSSTFFAVSAGTSMDIPPMAYTLGHMGSPSWASCEPSRGTYNWKPCDAFVLKAPRIGGVAQFDFTIFGTPSWALANHSSCTLMRGLACTAPPDNLQDFSDFVTQLAAHYTKIPVAYYELWNEANAPQFWSGTPQQLAQMSLIAYPILKTSGNKILTPSVIWNSSTIGSGVNWLTNYFSAGGLADVVSFHGYTCKTSLKTSGQCAMPESSLSSNASLQAMLSVFSGFGLPLAMSEGGWGVNGVTDPDLQVAYVTHWHVLAASQPGVLFANWFEWQKNAQSGAIETPTGAPNAAGMALEVIQGWIVNQTVNACSQQGSIWSCPVGNNLIVWDSSQTCSAGVCTTEPYTVSGFSQYCGVDGSVSQIQDATIDLGIKPVLLEP